MSGTHKPGPPLTPRHWPAWLAVGLIWLIGRTPRAVGTGLARPLGWLLARLMKRRRHVAQRNIERCFPELDAAGRERLVAASFRSLGRMLFETAWTWTASDRRIRRMSRYEGLQQAQAEVRDAASSGKGVLVVTAHFSCLEIGGRLTTMAFPRVAGIYRPLRSEVLEWYQNRCRARYAERMISKRDMRSAIRHLRGGGVLWYAPDQDFGLAQSEFVPFFGIPTATLAATARLVQMTDCRVVPMFPRYDESSGQYIVRFLPALEDFPGGDMLQDLGRINALLEEQVRQAPDQYWWIHRRFKTRPEGEPPFYDL
jgi:KDO2-lipid IV(A) lauroyltransferase